MTKLNRIATLQLFAGAVAAFAFATFTLAQSPPTLTPTPVKVEVVDTPVPVTPIITTPVMVKQAEPISVTLPISVWVAWVVSISVFLAACAIIWKFVLKAAELISDFSNYGSVLKDIAKEFKSNAGSTLRDSIDRLEAAAESAKGTAGRLEDLLSSRITALEERAVRDMATADARADVRAEARADAAEARVREKKQNESSS